MARLPVLTTEGAYYMQNHLFTRGALALVATAGALMGVPAVAAAYSSAGLDVSACQAGEFSQPFLSLGDRNWYEPAPGTTGQGFTPSGWTLSGGAHLVSVEAEGKHYSALDLPEGARAVSPVFCLESDYPTARAIMRNLLGGGVAFEVGYEGTPTWMQAQNTGQIHGAGTAWTATTPVNLQPYGGYVGWQPMHIVLEATGKGNEFQIAALYIDPRFSR